MSVASVAVGPASGCETQGTGVKLRPGRTRQYSGQFRAGTFAAACPSV